MANNKGISDNSYAVMKFIYFVMNNRDVLEAAFVAAAKAQQLNDRYFLGKFEHEKKSYCPEMAVMRVLTVMAYVSQDAFINYMMSNYKGY